MVASSAAAIGFRAKFRRSQAKICYNWIGRPKPKGAVEGRFAHKKLRFLFFSILGTFNRLHSSESMISSFDNSTDQELIDQTLQGQTAAFGILIRRYQDRLFNSMVHFLRNQSDAEDVVQDAFLLALRKLNTFQGNSQFYTWLYRIARNTAISKLRRKKPTVSLDATIAKQRLDFPDDGPAPSDQMERRERQMGLMAAMDQLSGEHREILILREMDELDYETISEILELPTGTVRSRLHRARSQLKELLTHAGVDSSKNKATRDANKAKSST